MLNITDDLDTLLNVLPARLGEAIRERPNNYALLEIVLDLGRLPEARYPHEESVLSDQEVTEADIDYVVERIGEFTSDNRAGIERTLHRISCIRNRKRRIVGLTCRVGRAVFGTIRIIDDLVRSDQSVLLLGRPGVGKTTMLREVARFLADELNKRVIVVDTSNEIAGDGDIPHPGIGSARRMQVPSPELQHAVMIEAVENHMPEVVVIDEIGTEQEAAAARTIAERGVQLIATAHGNGLDNLIINPTLSDLVGGIQSVTLSDEEARRRGTQKSILERKQPPTFDSVVEIQSWQKVAVHADVAATVDDMLRGRPASPEIRSVTESGELVKEQEKTARPPLRELSVPTLGLDPQRNNGPRVRVLPFGVNRGRAEQIVRTSALPVELVNDARNADAIMTTKAHYRNRPKAIRDAEIASVPVYVLRKNSLPQIEQCLLTILESRRPEKPQNAALQEAEKAIDRLVNGHENTVELAPQTSYIRRLQHQMAEERQVVSRSSGREPFRRVRLFRT